MAFEANVYNSDGVTLVYNLGSMLKNYTSGWPDNENPLNVTLSNLRSQGEIVIPAGNGSSEIIIGARLSASNYADLMSAFSTLKTTVLANTRYYLKIDTSSTTTDDIKCIRKGKIVIAKSDFVKWMYVQITFTKDSWS